MTALTESSYSAAVTSAILVQSLVPYQWYACCWPNSQGMTDRYKFSAYRPDWITAVVSLWKKSTNPASPSLGFQLEGKFQILWWDELKQSFLHGADPSAGEEMPVTCSNLSWLFTKVSASRNPANFGPLNVSPLSECFFVNSGA